MDLDADRAAGFGPAANGHDARRSPWPQRVRMALAQARALSRPVTLALSRTGSQTDPVAALVRVHRSIHPGADVGPLRRGYAVAERMHKGQTRKSGDPYITHPLAVATILAELGMDTTTLVAALLHDTVEDTTYTLPVLRSEFGPRVAHLVDGVTKFDDVFFGARAKAETIRKLIIAAGKDVRVLVIKIADRLHNMRTLDARSPASRTRIASATRDVLVPLCDRLGIQALKRDLEDAVLRYLDPEAYARIERFVAHRPQRRAYLTLVSDQTRSLLATNKIDANVSPRPRHFYSIWKDTVAGGYPEPFDPARITVVVDGTDADCYAALGVIHGRWRPLAGRFKDFIGAPKNNLYRSLHTTVIGPDDRTVEVLIRTSAMHRSAEYGVAAPYRYPKAGIEPGQDDLAWLHRVLRWESDTPDANAFVASLRTDLAGTEIQVIADGRSLILPAGATPVDVAYELGTTTGDRCRAATVNARLVPLTAPLADGDLVEIITAPPGQPAQPREEWLPAVRSPAARARLRRWFGPLEEEESPQALADQIRRGRVALGAELRQHDRGLPTDRPLRDAATKLGFPDPDALLVAIAGERIPAREVAERLIAIVDGVPDQHVDP